VVLEQHIPQRRNSERGDWFHKDKESRWRGVGPAARLSSWLTGLLNPYAKSGTRLFQPYFMNCFNYVSPLCLSTDNAAVQVSSRMCPFHNTA
jgi:hypothetical protein